MVVGAKALGASLDEAATDTDLGGSSKYSYIKGCHICQLSRNRKTSVRQLQQRIKLSTVFKVK